MSATAPADDARALRDELCRIGASLFARGYVHATAGNLSALTADGDCLITPTDACLGTLDAEQLALVAPDGTQRSGARASKTLALHRAIYAADTEARCVIHTHSTHLVALTLKGVWQPDDVLPPITPYYVMKVGHVPWMPYHRPGDPRVPALVAAAIHQARARHADPRGAARPLGPRRLAPHAGGCDGGAGRAGRNCAPVVDDRAAPGATRHAPARRVAHALRFVLVTATAP